VKDWKTTVAGIAKALFTVGTFASAATNQPLWVTALGAVLLALSQLVGGFVQADASSAAPVPKVPVALTMLALVAVPLGVATVACSAAGPVTSAVVSAACSLFVPLLASSPEGTIIAGTICQDFEPVVGPLVTAVVSAMGAADRKALAARMAVSASYAPLRIGGNRVGSIDKSVARAGASMGKWALGADGGADVAIVDAGK
jgi:hypothetical protein